MKLIRPNTLPDVVNTFSRSSIGTYFNSAGVMQTAPVDEPRFDQNPITRQSSGLLVEGSRTNLLLQSSVVVGADWALAANLTRLGSASAPDGTSTAGTFTTTSNSNAFLRQGIQLQANTAYTLTVFARLRSGAAPISGSILVVDRDVDGFPGTLERVETPFLGSGLDGLWRRFTLSFTNIAATAGQAYLCVDFANGAQIDIWGAQLEVGALASSYIPTTTAAVTRAADIVGSQGLLVSTATEAHATWSAGTTYAAAVRVIYGTSIYQSLQASNLNKQPDTSPTWWTRIGPSNKWAMFDDQVGTPTTASGSLTAVFSTGIMDSLAVVGIDAEMVTLTVRDGPGGTIVYQRSASVTGSEVADWSEYFFTDPTVRRTIAVFYDIPPFASSVATLEITSGGTVSLGMVTFGRIAVLGDSQFGAQAGITDYSRKETDEFGTTTFVKRAFAKRMTGSVQVQSLQINRVQRVLYDLRATPVLWIATDVPEFSEPMTVYGFYRDFYCAINAPTVSTYQLEIEGLI